MSLDQNNQIEQIKYIANQWLLNSALPLWFDKGIDWDRGGFFESINLNDFSCAAKYKRVRVLTRQIFAFCIASRLGLSSARLAVTHGLEFLLDKYKLPSGGFASRVTLKGSLIDDPIDFYDLAFCLFALAHAYKLLGDSKLKDEALCLTQFISEHFAHSSGGYIESIPATIPRRQNPHMHFLEALLEWRLLSDNRIFHDLSDDIVCLFFQKFYFSDQGALIEYFDNNLVPVAGLQGSITEPGHHFEWVWLLDRYKAVSGARLNNYQKLYEFGYKNGLNPHTQLLWSEVTCHGEPVKSPVRLWPHTEWIKAELANNGEPDQPARVYTAWRALSRFLDCPQPGLWYETFDHETNTFLNAPSPASSLYHIVLAIESLNNFDNTNQTS